MTSMPPSGTSSVPKRVKDGKRGSFGAALKSGAATIDSVELQDIPTPVRKPPQVRIAKGTYGNLLVTKILKASGLVLLLGFMVYFSFAATIVRVIPTGSLGLVPVKNNTFTGGLVPPGEQIIVDMVRPQGTDMVARLQQAFVPTGTASWVRVEAGPWDEFTWNNGAVILNQRVLPMQMPDKPRSTTLSGTYLVTCLAGDCVVGNGYIIPTAHIIGIPLLPKEDG